MANLIEVKNLTTSFFTADGELRAVDEVVRWLRKRLALIVVFALWLD